MARKRQARRCKAHRSDGQPCKAWAILGGEVCSAHGGCAGQVRDAALLGYWRARTVYAFNEAWLRWRREVRDWEVRRVLAAADILDTSPDQVTQGDLLWLAIDGQIASEETMPALRVDGRYGPRRPSQLATRAARQAARKAAGA